MSGIDSADSRLSQRSFAMTRLMILLCAMGLLGVQVDAAEPTVIKPAWEVKLPPYGFSDDHERDEFRVAAGWATVKINKARKELLEANRPIVPPNEPLVISDRVAVQTPLGLITYSLRADPIEKPPLKEGELYWMMSNGNGLLETGKSGGARKAIDDFQAENRNAINEQIFSHSLGGQISRNATLTFFVYEFGIVPPVRRIKDRLVGSPFYSAATTDNSIMGMESETGKLRIRLRGSQLIERNLLPGFFLGTPFVVGDSIYAVLERDSKLQLILLDPKLVDRDAFKKAIQHEVSVMAVPEDAQSDLTRRIHALIPIATTNLIVCPTHLGAVIAVNRDDHKVAWTARYGKPEVKRFENFSCTWRVRPMLVAGDLLIYGPADAESLYAFKLADGKEAWKIERGKGVYLAGLHDGKAIVVDSNAIRAIDATNGKEVWKAPFDGTLTGYGVFQGDRFYQPIGLGKAADEGVLQIIELKQGKAVGTIQRADKKEIGNLLIHKAKLISQTFESLSVFAMP
jgi:hypothetical protein